ncbi:MAG: GAF domain-containing protein [Candidatus Thermoplasmatota archaeon]|nr:GAF domain-containing protein [Candidatus Thermoplasmatota archaeon]
MVHYHEIEQTIQHLLTAKAPAERLDAVVACLYEAFDKYTWVGIYLVKGDHLILSSWRGTQATEHTQIPLGAGVCGAAARSGRTERVDDVSKDHRYLSCFLSTRSELVVPIKRDGVVIGEIDIDSDRPAAFDPADEHLLEKVADMLQQHI